MKRIFIYAITSLILMVLLFFAISYSKYKNVRQINIKEISYHMEMFLKMYKHVYFKYPEDFCGFLEYLEKDDLFKNHTGKEIPDFLFDNKLMLEIDTAKQNVCIVYYNNIAMLDESVYVPNISFLNFILNKKIVILEADYYTICDFGLPPNLAMFSKGELINDREIEKQIKINVSQYIFRNTDTAEQMNPLDIKGLLFCASLKDNRFDTKIICDTTQGRFDNCNVTDSLNIILNSLDLKEVDMVYLPIKLSEHFKVN